MVVGGVAVATIVVDIAFSGKHCVLIGTSEGSLSYALIWDLLAVESVGVVVVLVVVGVSVGVCAWPLVFWSHSLSWDPSLLSCWYMSSTMGFHNRTLALMNQFET